MFKTPCFQCRGHRVQFQVGEVRSHSNNNNNNNNNNNDFIYERVSLLVAQLVKNPPAMREIWVRSLGLEEPLEKGKATHSSILAWRILYSPWGFTELDTNEQLSFSCL